MVSRCANPDCGRRFHSLKEGKLVVLAPDRNPSLASGSHLDVAWLCSGCSQLFTIGRGSDGLPQLVRLQNKAAAAA